MNLKNLFAKLTSLFFVFLLFAGSSFAQTTYFVDGTGGGNDSWTGTAPAFVSGNVGPKATIQAMLNDPAVVNGDLIEILAGAYPESVTLTKRVELYVNGGAGITVNNLTLNTGSTTNTNICESNYGAGENITVTGTLKVQSGDYNSTAGHVILANGGVLELAFDPATYSGLQAQVDVNANQTTWNFTYAGNCAYTSASDFGDANPLDVNVQTSGTLTLDANLTTGGDLLIASGATLALNGFDVAVTGDFTNNGAYTGATTDQVQMAGGTVSGTGTFMDLVINGASALGSNITMVNVAQGTASILTLNANLDLDGFNLETPGSLTMAAAGNIIDGSVAQTGTFIFSGTAGTIGTVTWTVNAAENIPRLTVSKPFGSTVQVVDVGGPYILTVTDQFSFTGGIINLTDNSLTLGAAHSGTAAIGGNLNGAGNFTVSSANDMTVSGAGAINTPFIINDLGAGAEYTFTQLITVGNNITITSGKLITSSLQLVNGAITINGGEFEINTSNLSVTSNVTLADGTTLSGTSNIVVNGNVTDDGTGNGTAIDKDSGSFTVAGNLTLTGNTTYKAGNTSTTTGNIAFAGGAVDVNGDLASAGTATFGTGDADISGNASSVGNFTTGTGDVIIHGTLTVGGNFSANAGIYDIMGTGQSAITGNLIAAAANANTPGVRFRGALNVGGAGNCSGVGTGQKWRFDGTTNFTGDLDFDNLTTAGATLMTVDFYGNMSARDLLLNDELVHVINFNDASTPVGQLRNIAFTDLGGADAAVVINVNSSSATSFYTLKVSGDITFIDNAAIACDANAWVVMNGAGALATYANAQNIILTDAACAITNLEIANTGTDATPLADDGGAAGVVDETQEAVYISTNTLTVTHLKLTTNGINGTNLNILATGTITRGGGLISVVMANAQFLGGVNLVYVNTTNITTGLEYTAAAANNKIVNFSLTTAGTGSVTLTSSTGNVTGLVVVGTGRTLALTNGANNYNFTQLYGGGAPANVLTVDGSITGTNPYTFTFNAVQPYDIEGTGSMAKLTVDYNNQNGAVLNLNGPATLSSNFVTQSTGGPAVAETLNWNTGGPSTIGGNLTINNVTTNVRKNIAVTGNFVHTSGVINCVNVAGDTWYNVTVGGNFTNTAGNFTLMNLDITGTMTWTAGTLFMSGNGNATVNGNSTINGGTFNFPAASTSSMNFKGATNGFNNSPTFTFNATATGRVRFNGSAAQSASITGGNLTIGRVELNNAAGLSVTSIANDWNVANLLLTLGTLTHNGLLDMGNAGTDRIIRDAGMLATFAAAGPGEVEFIGAADTQAGFELVNTLNQLIANGLGKYTLDKAVTILTGGTLNLSKGILDVGSNLLVTQNGCTVTRAEGSMLGTPTYGNTTTLQYFNTVNDLVSGPEFTNDGSITTYNQNSPGKKVTLGANARVAGAANILFGTFDLATFTWNVSGNLTCNGAFTTGVAGNIRTTGANAALTGTAVAWPNLVIAKTAGQTLTFTPTGGVHNTGPDWTFDTFTGTTGNFAIAAMDDITILGDFNIGANFGNFNTTNGDDWFFQGDFTWTFSALTSGALTQVNGVGAGNIDAFNFTGTAAQTITCNNPTLEVVTINNTAGVDLGGNLSLDDGANLAALTLTNGALRTGAFSVQIGLITPALQIPVARTNGYIVGNLWIYLDTNPAAAVNNVFPMGTDSGNYRPMTVGFAARAAGISLFSVAQVQHVDEMPVGEVGIPLTSGGVTVNKLTPAYWVAGFYDGPTNTVLQTPTQNPTITLGAGGFLFGDITKIRALYRLTNVMNTWLIPGTFNGSYYAINNMPTVVHSGVQGWTLEPQQLFAVGYESTFANTAIADQTVYTNDDPVVIDLADYVTGNIGAVTYAVLGSDDAVGTAVLAGSELTLTGVTDGTFTVDVTYTDVNGDELMDQFTVTVGTLSNLAPSFVDVPGDVTITAATTLPYAFTFTADDPDADALTFALEAPAPSGAAIDPDTGEFTFTPVANGVFVVTVTVTDPAANFDTYAFTITVDDAVGVEDLAVPTEFSLSQNYPNPFNPTTIIRFGLPEAAHVVLTVYNILGQQIAQVVDESMSAGYHEVQFDASNLNSGMYIYKIQAGNFVSMKKMMLTK